MIKLSKRLMSAAALVRRGGIAADIGTDHAFLPAYLVLNGICSHCFASDIGRGPLDNAKKTLEKFGVCDKVTLRLSDGLKEFSKGEADDIIICGMGGNLIEDILLACPWVRADGIHLVLQPMTHFENVRKYLFENGFTVEREVVVFDEGRYYLTVSAYYTGNVPVKNTGREYFGDTPFEDDGFRALTERQHRRLKTRLDAISAAGRFPGEQEEIKKALLYYEGMKKQ